MTDPRRSERKIVRSGSQSTLRSYPPWPHYQETECGQSPLELAGLIGPLPKLRPLRRDEP
jgi:hypothetical protein